MVRKRIQALCLTAITAVSLCGSVHAEEQTIQADQIIKNAKIFTSDEDNPEATALVVKDGKFVYVGDEAGLSDYEGEVTDLTRR